MFLSLISSVGLAASVQLVSDDDMAAATATFTSWCANAVEDRIDRTSACACGTGVLSGEMTDKEFVVLAGLTPYAGDEEAMRQAVTVLIEEDGLSAGFIRNAARKNSAAAARADRVCAILEKPSEQWRMLASINGGESIAQEVNLPKSARADIADIFRALGNAVYRPADAAAAPTE
ncbi:hypothetical protein [Parvularcula marina]|uniref:Uncharacterized protein n=1 Tax=Parvularcula marina TaxID=2292771 RepID=A0A371RKK6_9PROT|nr:hypothetical protein [Parvularcula marina]RFB05977.1 hypothetical protein DX908_12320 [Parvularcula marina]